MKTNAEMAAAFRQAAAMTLHYRHRDLAGMNAIIEEVNEGDSTTDLIQAFATLVWHLTPGDTGEQVLHHIVNGCVIEDER